MGKLQIETVKTALSGHKIKDIALNGRQFKVAALNGDVVYRKATPSAFYHALIRNIETGQIYPALGRISGKIRNLVIKVGE